jgi:hypothetical protein
MTSSASHSAVSLAAQYLSQISRSSPFARSRDGYIHLLTPLAGVPVATQRQALDHLVSLGALCECRYIDAKPQPAIIAIRA